MNKQTLIIVGLLLMVPSAIAASMDYGAAANFGLIGAAIGAGVAILYWVFLKIAKPEKLKPKRKPKREVKLKNRKMSLAAKFLIFLLSIRTIGQIVLVFILLSMAVFPILNFLLVIVLLGLYGTALIGIVKKTKWGLNVVIAVATLDIILTAIFIFIGGSDGTYFFGLIVDLLLLGLAGNIKNRIRGHKKR